jgi:6-phosphogluconolactonase
MTFKTFSTADEWVAASVAYFEKIAHEREYVSLALSGGSTPVLVYEAIATQTTLPKRCSIKFFQVDERYVPADHKDSNQKLLYDHFIRAFDRRPDGKNYLSEGVFFRTDQPIEKALKEYTKAIQYEMSSWPAPWNIPFSLAILGLGPDGHTASLFPHSPALYDTEHAVAHTTTDAFPVHDRLTLTFPTIMASHRLLLLVRGREKQAIIDDLLHSNKTIDELPAKKLLEHPDLTIFYCTE